MRTVNITAYLTYLWLLLLCIIYTPSFGQKEYNIWYFGRNAGLNFNTAPPSAISSNMHSIEGASGICDSAGNLLFYTNCDTVYNRLHQPMKNGIFNPYGYRASSRQGAMVLPYPKQKGKYYLINTNSNEGFGWKVDSMLRYSVIDISGDGGLGEIVTKNVPLVKYPREGFAVTAHSNSFDYWIVAGSQADSTVYTIRTFNGTMGTPVKRIKAIIFGYSMKFSPDSRILKLDTIIYGSPGGNYVSQLFKFDNNTGELTERIKLINSFSSFDFSPSSRFLYAEEIIMDSALSYHVDLVQYDLSVWNRDSILKSRIVLDSAFRSPSNPNYIFVAAGMQLGPDKKIYIFRSDRDELSVIHDPNKKGKDCDYDKDVIDLNGSINHFGAPYYPTFPFRTKIHKLPPDAVVCENDSFTINPFSDASHFIWNTGDTTPAIRVGKPGTYWVKGIVDGDTLIDSINIAYKKKYTVFIGNDTAFCGKFSHLLDAGKGFKSYLWNTGDTTATKLVDMPGIYAVTVRDSNSCNSGDTIDIGQLTVPSLIMEYDTITCGYIQLSTSQANGIKYRWSTGDTATAIKITQKGTYKLTASNKFCSLTDSVRVDKLPLPEIDLGPDTTLVCDRSIELKAAGDSGSYLWNTGQITPSIKISDGGIYKVTVSRNNCSAADSVQVSLKKPFKVDLGNDTLFCGSFSYLLNAGPGGVTYLWNTGELTATKQIDQPGTYFIETTDSNQCTSKDTVIIDQLKAPAVQVNYVDCEYITLGAALENGVNYYWSTGETTPSVNVNEKGIYMVTVRKQYCLLTDTVVINRPPMPEINIGPDTVLCDNSIELVAGDSGEYLWNTGDIAPSVKVDKPGYYWVSVSRNNCTATDSIFVEDGCESWYYIPTAFTPGSNDELNSVFSITGSFLSAKMLVFNRWGELMFEASGEQPYWDGTYKNSPCPEGVYIFLVQITGKKKGKIIKENLSGTVTLLR